MERIIRIHSVLELTGLSKSSIYQLIAQGKFPPPVKLSRRAAGWKFTEIQNWINSRTTS